VRFDSRGEPQPDLAETWGISQDSTTYNFLLKPDIFWHDGQPITTDDVVFTFNLLKNQSQWVPSDLQAFWKDVDIKKLDERNLQFRLPEPFAPFLDYLSVGLLPSHLLGTQKLDQLASARFNLQPVGSGPYRLNRLTVENGKVTGVVLTAFDKYYGDKPYIPQVVFKYYPDAQAAFNGYQNKEVQGIGQVPTSLLPVILKEPNLLVYSVRQPDLSLVLFNLKDKDVAFLQDSKVRQALMVGINRQWIVDHVLSSQAILAKGPLFPGTWAYYEGLESYSYNPEQSVKLLKAAGYALPTEGDKVWKKEDVSISFTLLYPDLEPYSAVAQQIQQDWAAINIPITLQAMPYDQLIKDHLDTRSYQAALVDLNLSGSPDPDPYPFWDQAQVSTGQNYSQWDDRSVSEYLEQARLTTDTAQRALLYRNFQVIFNKQLPALPLYYPVYTYAVDRSVQGIRLGPLFDPAERLANLPTWFLANKTTSQNSILTNTQP
jgi:peptide/nickel transport system substrate-binding protein